MERFRTEMVGTFGPRSSDEMLRLLAHGVNPPRCDLIELRLDFLVDADFRLPELIAASPVPVIATCRRGGEVEDEDERLALLERAGELGAAWIDVEHDVPADKVPTGGFKVLRSLHVDSLPPHPEALIDRLLDPPADAAKFVVRTGSEADALAVLELVASRPGKLAAHVIQVPFTRNAAATLGSVFTYAALRPGGRMDVALPTVGTAVRQAQLHRVREGTRVFALLGNDVERSISPDMLNHAFEALGDDVVSIRWSCEDPGPALDAVRRFSWTGAAVTMPFKERVSDRLAVVQGDALLTGSINTVVRTQETLAGFSTDGMGLAVALRPHLPEPVGGKERLAGRTALVLGAGGAARAAALRLLGLGATVWIHARRREAAEEVARVLNESGRGEVLVAATAEEAAAAAPAVVVDATPAGPPGGGLFFDPGTLEEPAVVLDMLVAARPTALLEAAAAAGHQVVPGFDMLSGQAFAQVAALVSERGSVSDDLAAAMAQAGRARLAAAERGVLLVGLRCSGKTVVGEALAEMLAMPLIDTDREVERRTGRSPDDFIRLGEEAALREAEREVLGGLEPARTIVSAGGGASKHLAQLEALARSHLVVLLDASDAVLLARMAAEPRAPLTEGSPIGELAWLRSERMEVYRDLADVVLDSSQAPPQELAEEIAARLD